MLSALLVLVAACVVAWAAMLSVAALSGAQTVVGVALAVASLLVMALVTLGIHSRLGLPGHECAGKGAQKRLRQEKEARQEAETALYSMAHDMKAPLVSLDHLIGDLDERSRSKAADTGESVAHSRMVVDDMRTLVDQVLDFARVVAQDGEGDGRPASVSVLVDEAIALLRPRCREKDIELRVRGGPAVGLAVAPGALRHVLLNLMDNALKYGPDRGAMMRVSWHMESVGGADRFVLEVADNGDGIEAKDRERVFQLLQRVPDRQGRDLPGTGVGLALVRRMVKKEGGRVEIQQAPEGGALFRVSFPASRVHTERGWGGSSAAASNATRDVAAPSVRWPAARRTGPRRRPRPVRHPTRLRPSPADADL